MFSTRPGCVGLPLCLYLSVCPWGSLLVCGLCLVCLNIRVCRCVPGSVTSLSVGLGPACLSVHGCEVCVHAHLDCAHERLSVWGFLPKSTPQNPHLWPHWLCLPWGGARAPVASSEVMGSEGRPFFFEGKFQGKRTAEELSQR